MVLTNMENLAKQVLICSLLTTLIFLSYPAVSQEAAPKDDFNYDLKSNKGPFNWGELNPAWSLCKKGSMQSPIHLAKDKIETVTQLGKLNVNYNKNCNATAVNMGRYIMLKWNEQNNFIEINGTQYQLKTTDWHTPSEHTIDGKRMDLEVHMVHESSSGQIAVVGTVYRIGDKYPDAALDKVILGLKEIPPTAKEAFTMGSQNPNFMLKNLTKYYRYTGSLTTPPCTENVIWTIFREVGTCSADQLELLRKNLRPDSKANARPTQPLNHRSVELNLPEDPPADEKI